MKRVVVTNSPDETERLGRWMGAHLRPGDVLSLIGDLGTGKTCLTRGIAAGLGADPAVVSSPTFVLVHEYPLPATSTDRPAVLYHVDPYRLDSARDFEDIGGEETFSERSVCVVEWADRVAGALPDDALRVSLTVCGESSREIAVVGDAERFPWLAALDGDQLRDECRAAALP
jgi:tRNA threonylcarbamoyladenosine biosynthesis protein TsaE